MKRPILIVTALLTFCLFVKTSFAQTAPATPAATVVAAAQASDRVSVAAFLIKVANLQDALSAAGPFTIFAPTNDAFSKLSTSKLDSLVADPAKLATLLKAHVVVGKFGKEEIQKGLAASKERKMSFKTIDGGNLTLSYANGKISLTDDKGNTSNVLIFNLQATNGVVNGLDDVLTGK
jgi:uncharacterized surface protein with fasciclin (FAS1) repeats